MKLFSVDGKLYKFFIVFENMVILNFWLLLMCIPIVTSGASVCAAYKVTIKMIKNEEGYVTKEFFKAFKENLKQGIVLFFISAIATYMIWLNLNLFFSIDDASVIIFIIAVLAAFYFFFSLLYTFPLIAIYENTIIQTMRNSMKISTRYIFRTFIMLLACVVEICFLMYNNVTLIFALILGPVLLIYTNSTMCVNIFDDIERKNIEE